MIYEVKFKVDSPVVVDSEIHFDGILYAVSPAAHNKDVFVTRFTDPEQLHDLPIPVDCIKLGKSYVYCCSTGDFENARKIVDMSTKRKDGIDYMYYHSKQCTKTGVDKDCMIKIYAVVCDSVSFLCSTTSLKELTRYCKRIKSIGGMRKQGYGHVADFEVIEHPELAWQDCIISHNRAIRSIPQVFLQNECESTVRCKAPYFLMRGKERASQTGEIAYLKEEVFLSEFRW